MPEEHEHNHEHRIASSGGKVCGCQHHNITPILVIIFAIAVLLVEFNVITFFVFSIVWPILLIIGAGSKVAAKNCKCC